jgi:hypothetical protein
MTKRTISARAQLHIELGVAQHHARMEAKPSLYEVWDYKDCAADMAERILKSAQGDPKAYALLRRKGVWPDAPRSTLAVIEEGV